MTLLFKLPGKNLQFKLDPVRAGPVKLPLCCRACETRGSRRVQGIWRSVSSMMLCRDSVTPAPPARSPLLSPGRRVSFVLQFTTVGCSVPLLLPPGARKPHEPLDTCPGGSCASRTAAHARASSGGFPPVLCRGIGGDGCPCHASD